MAWPPPYTIRRSQRAKHISLKISPDVGLEIILPLHQTEKAALAFLNSKRQWVEKHARLLAPEQTAIAASRYECPTRIVLPAIEREWQVHYCFIPGVPFVALQEETASLHFAGKVKDFKLCAQALKPWLKELAQTHLTTYLETVAARCKLPFKRVSFRFQRTLWGSCSAKHEISLNCKLLFLPRALVDYVLIHELCHTKHFNHSKSFWTLVAKFDSNYRQHERELRRADQYIPKWYGD